MELNIWDIIAREVTGELTDTERVELVRWREESAENQAAYEEAREAWDFSAKAALDFEPNVDEAWKRVQAHIDITAEEEQKVIALKQRSAKRNKFILRIAAVLLVALVSVMTFRFIDGDQEIEAPAYASETTDGEAKEVVLPDGSTVWLNANSKLEWAADFKGDKRRVRLTGEAFFEVTKNPEKPFQIETASTRTTVLGTSFSLRENADGSGRKLVVNTGKVAYAKKETNEGALTLIAGDVGSFEDDQLVKSQNDNPNAFAFKTRELILNDITLQECADVMISFFGVNVKVDASLQEMPLQMGSEVDPELDVLLKQLSSANQIDASFNNGTVVFSPR